MVKDALHKKHVVKEVQLMMLEILAARHQHLALSAAAGTSSEPCSSCTESSSSLSSEKSMSGSMSDSCSSSVQRFVNNPDVLQLIAIHSGSDHPT